MNQMIVAFKVKNFRSIVETALSMSCPPPPTNAPGERIAALEANFENKQNQSLSPIAAIYGRNASGKSNFLSALIQLQRIVEKGTVKGFYNPNIIQVASNRTEFEIWYTSPSFDNKSEITFKYRLVYREEEILTEILYRGDEAVYIIDNTSGTQDFNGIANNDYSNEHIERLRKTECCNESSKQTRLVLTWLAQQYTNLSKDIIAAYQFFALRFYYRPITSANTYGYYSLLHEGWPSEEERHDVLKNISMHLANLDTGVSNIICNERTVETNPDIDLSIIPNLNGATPDGLIKVSNNQLSTEFYFSEHVDGNGDTVILPLSEESAGTNILFSLLVFILYAFKSKGSVIVIDELDRSMHPLLLKQLVHYFTNPLLNRNNAQLIFTLHDTELLSSNVLYSHEYRIIEKNAREGSKLRRLSTDYYKIVDLRSNYLQGMYSGIPHVRIQP